MANLSEAELKRRTERLLTKGKRGPRVSAWRRSEVTRLKAIKATIDGEEMSFSAAVDLLTEATVRALMDGPLQKGWARRRDDIRRQMEPAFRARAAATAPYPPEEEPCSE